MPRFVCVLTGPPTAAAIDEAVLSIARAAIPEGDRRPHRWLAPGDAWQTDLPELTTEAVAAIRADIAQQLAGRAVDVNIVLADPAKRRKTLLIADMESTIIGQECLDELAEVVGLRERVVAITERAMRGELAFEAAINERVGLLAELDADVLLDIYQTRISLMPGAAVLVATMKQNGAYCALVSGGFSFFTERIAARLGFDDHQANRLEIADRKLTGRVIAPILGREAKLAALLRYCANLGIEPDQAIAVGDGANDLGMLAAAGLGVAFRAKPLVAAAVATTIQHGDLTALLYLQGYPKAAFADAA